MHVADVKMWPGPHTEPCQDAIQLCLVIEGTFEQRLKAHTKTLSRSTLRISPPNTPATLQFGSAGARCFFLEYSDLQPKDRRYLTPDTPIFLPDSQSADLAWKAYEAFYTDGEAPLVLDTLVLELFARAARMPDVPTGPPPGWLRQVKDWLHDCYDQSLVLADAAMEVGVTPVHLSRAFRQHYGCTMGDYLRVLRLAHVQRALAERDDPLVQVALDAGFYDQSHMTRIFKQSLGITPGIYRQSLNSSTTPKAQGS